MTSDSPFLVLRPDCPDDLRDQRMRYRRVRNRLDLLHCKCNQIGEQTIKAEQRVVIGTRDRQHAQECTVQPNPVMLRICHPQTNSREQTVKECRNERP